MLKKLFLLLILSIRLFSQELDATVILNCEKLSTEYKDYLADFSNQLQNYLNNNRFFDQEWQGPKIKCAFSIIILSGSNQKHYTAQVSITSQRLIYKSSPIKYTPILKLFDPSWEFNYERAQSFSFNPSQFEPLLSFLNYYAYVIIGMDLNSYGALSGQETVQKAMNLALMGESSAYEKGWGKGSGFTRKTFCDDILNEKYRPFMENFYKYHYYGLDNLSKDKIKAQKKFIELVDNLYLSRTKMNLSNTLIRSFFDAKYIELAELFADINDQSAIKKLMSVDPAHTTRYNEVLK